MPASPSDNVEAVLRYLQRHIISTCGEFAQLWWPSINKHSACLPGMNGHLAVHRAAMANGCIVNTVKPARGNMNASRRRTLHSAAGIAALTLFSRDGRAQSYPASFEIMAARCFLSLCNTVRPPAQLPYAKKIARGKGLVIPDEAKARSAAMSAWIDANRGLRRRKLGRTRRRAAQFRLRYSVQVQSCCKTSPRRRPIACTFKERELFRWPVLCFHRSPCVD